VWPDGYYVPTSTGDEVIEKHVCVAERARMLRGDAARELCRIVPDVNFLNTSDLDGRALPPPGSPNLVLAAGGPGGAPAGLLGLKRSDKLGDVLRGIFEGIAYAHRVDIERLLSGYDAAKPTTIRLAGGASRSAIWAQIFADVLGLPVEVTDGTELGARGVAIASAVAIGAYGDFETAISKMVRVRQRWEPNVAKRDVHSRKYARFLGLTRALAREWSH
jgi:hypothetical protein